MDLFLISRTVSVSCRQQQFIYLVLIECTVYTQSSQTLLAAVPRTRYPTPLFVNHVPYVCVRPHRVPRASDRTGPRSQNTPTPTTTTGGEHPCEHLQQTTLCIVPPTADTQGGVISGASSVQSGASTRVLASRPLCATLNALRACCRASGLSVFPHSERGHLRCQSTACFLLAVCLLFGSRLPPAFRHVRVASPQSIPGHTVLGHVHVR
jgi:hypothetical protein